MAGLSNPIIKLPSLDNGMLHEVGTTIKWRCTVINTGEDGDVRLRYGIGFIKDGMIYYVKSYNKDVYLPRGFGHTFTGEYVVPQEALDRQAGIGWNYVPTHVRFYFLAGHSPSVLKWVWDDDYGINLILEGNPTDVWKPIKDILKPTPEPFPEPEPEPEPPKPDTAPFTSFSYLTGYTVYNKPAYIRPLGQAYYRRFDKCPDWRTKCTYSCFGTFNAEGWTEQQIIDKCINNAFNRSDAVILKKSFYNSYKEYIDDYRKRNPVRLIYIGSPSNTGSGCGHLTYNEIPKPDIPETDTDNILSILLTLGIISAGIFIYTQT